MTSTPSRPDHRSLPRKKRAPSERDQEILVAYRVQGRTQQQLADDYHVSQRRISAIVHRVEKWRAGLHPAVDEVLDSRERQRIERWLERERLQGIYSRTMRALDQHQAILTTVREGERDGKPFKEETRREQPPNVQLLKVALRAATDLGKLNDKPEPPPAPPKSAKGSWWSIHKQLCDLRREKRGLGDTSEGRSDGVDDFGIVLNCMMALVSQEQEGEVQSPRSEGVGCISAAQCTNANDDGLADDDAGAFRPPERTHAPYEETAASNGSTCSNATASERAETPVVEPAATAPTASPQPTLDLGPRTLDPSPAAPQKKKPAAEQPLSLAERRWRHQLKLDQLREARRRGLPYSFVFDPEDGPLPPRYCHVDGADY